CPDPRRTRRHSFTTAQGDAAIRRSQAEAAV
ncbi:hypothetical protein AK812_SmicGene47492, partial [Symbiodinium microadriaticum]